MATHHITAIDSSPRGIDFYVSQFGIPIDIFEQNGQWVYEFEAKGRYDVPAIIQVFFDIPPAQSGNQPPPQPAGGDVVSAIARCDENGETISVLSGLSITFQQLTDGAGQASIGDRYLFWVSLLDTNNIVTGGPGDDALEVGAGGSADVDGGNGTDKLYVWHSKSVHFDGGSGVDTILFTAGYGDSYPTAYIQQLIVDLSTGTGQNPYGGTLSFSNVENVVGTAQADSITGNDFANTIGDPVDTGADIVDARGGNDVVQLGWSAALGGAHVDGGTGFDELRFLVSNDSGSSAVVRLDLASPVLNTFVFNGGAYVNIEKFTAQSFGDSIDTDIFAFGGSSSGETVTGTTIQTYVTGAARALVGRDQLSGRGGNDTLTGLAGNDVLAGGDGNDSLNGGDDADTLDGDGGNDTLVGGTGTDTLRGGAGNDTLDGGAGNDTLDGGDGNDVITGGAGADTLRGGLGNDSYKLENAADKVSDTGGTADLVTSTITRSLLAAGLTTIENLTLLSGNINGTGNNLANVITGSVGANVLAGGIGNDTLRGMNGNDTLAGGAGIDTLAGGGGNDFFLFNAPLSAANRDIVTDFFNVAGNNDAIRLENAIMTRLGPAGVLNAKLFFVGAAAHDADDRVIYNRATGVLSYDANGNLAGGVTVLATLTTKPTLTFADFVVV